MMTLALLLCLACSPGPSRPLTDQDRAEAARVMVVMNANSQDSAEVASYYVAKRAVPKGNVCQVRTVTTDNVPYKDYYEQIEKPLKAAIAQSGRKIDFIVTTKGLPIRVDDDGGCAVDAFLAAMNLPYTTIMKIDDEGIKKNLNPYYGKSEPFQSSKFKGMYLVSRLDGPSVASAKALVDRSLAAKADKGPFLFDQAGNRNGAGYGELNKTLETAAQKLKAAGFQTNLETTPAFVAPTEPLMGYCSWGSNDDRFSRETYDKLSFKPGAIAETFVSTSGRTFARQEGGQSQITDLIQGGVTGVKGYVSEPYTFSLARPEILFDRYTKGFNLAESYFMASLVLKWKDMVVGDPLCRPYKP